MWRYCARCNTVVPSNEYAKHTASHRPWTPGWGKLRQMVLDRDDRRCVVCGSTADLEAHHINGDPSDNRLENLECRCRSHNRHGRIDAA